MAETPMGFALILLQREAGQMKKVSSITIVAMLLLIVGCTRIPDGLQPVSGFELERYLGKWYEIARLDHSFERNLSNVTAHYSPRQDGGVEVMNKGFNQKSGKWEMIIGKAFFIEKENVGSIKVSFFGPFYSGYHIIALDQEDYSYAMVAGPSRSYLWILSRNKTLDSTILEELVNKARQWGFETDKLIYVNHNLSET
jgi:apolipoprotein D and lipocalin family protein